MGENFESTTKKGMAVAELEELKARIARERDLELTLSWRLERKGTKL